MFKNKPDKKITSKYSNKLILFSQLPFGKSWKGQVSKNDLLVMEAYQNHIRNWYLSTIIPFIMFFIVLYFIYIV